MALTLGKAASKHFEALTSNKREKLCVVWQVRGLIVLMKAVTKSIQFHNLGARPVLTEAQDMECASGLRFQREVFEDPFGLLVGLFSYANSVDEVEIDRVTAFRDKVDVDLLFPSDQLPDLRFHFHWQW